MFISEALAQQGPPPGAGGVLPQLIFLGAIFLLFYFLLIRPQRKRQKEHGAMVAALEKGDEVITSGGILGEIRAVDEHYLNLRVASNVQIHIQKTSVHAVLPKGTLKNIASE